jgi:DNA-binding Xre family transcriptional regulator
MGVTDKNTELALWKNGKVETFSFLEYEKLIKALESNPTDVEN